MPISTTKRSALMFAREKSAITGNKYPRWSHLNTAEQEFWKSKAKSEIIFPDLRGGYTMQDEMVHTLAIALYETYIYYKQGGGEQPTFGTEIERQNNTRTSLFDAIDAELKDGYP